MRISAKIGRRTALFAVVLVAPLVSVGGCREKDVKTATNTPPASPVTPSPVLTARVTTAPATADVVAVSSAVEQTDAPVSRGSLERSNASWQIIININERGEPVISGKEYDLKSLGDLLSNTLKERPNTNITIRADERAIVKHFAAVANVCKRSGAQDVKLSYVTGGTQ